MAENEKRLRDRARGLAAVDPGVSSAMEDDLDALIAEHRAEVEHLKKDKESLRLCYEAATAREPAARDAALEAVASDDPSSPVDGNGAGYGHAFADGWKARGLRVKRIADALKSNPAERYLRESEVREVLRTAMQATQQERGARSDAGRWLRFVSERLGVDFDAEAAVYERGGFVPPKEER